MGAIVSSISNDRPVFFHYMIGTIDNAHCRQDIIDAQNLGVDAFALNIDTVTADWALNTTASLFQWANAFGFKLFFSFDMNYFTHPNQFTDFLASYVTNPAYYKYNGRPFVSTFRGGEENDDRFKFGQDSVNNGWNIALQQRMSDMGHPIYFVPAFEDTYGTYFFQRYLSVDGAMNWRSWPDQAKGKTAVDITEDLAYLVSTRKDNLGKTFMMGASPLQFKHIGGGQNFYSRGEQNLENRFGQILDLQPDFVQFQTWNDSGESHYMGNIWPEPIAGTPIPAYTNGYDHRGFWAILPAFIRAYKSGARSTSTMYPTNNQTTQGVFWHHTLLAGADCRGDWMGAPNNMQLVEDRVTVVVLVAAGTTDLRVDVWSGDNYLGGIALVPGYNSYSATGMTTGKVRVTVKSATGSTVRDATGPIPVTSSSNIFNYNYQVVPLQTL